MPAHKNASWEGSSLSWFCIGNLTVWLLCFGAVSHVRCAAWDGGWGQQIFLQGCLASDWPFLLWKLGHETVTGILTAMTVWMLPWKDAIQDKSPAFLSMFFDLSKRGQGPSLWSALAVMEGKVNTWSIFPSCPSLPHINTAQSSEFPTSRKDEAGKGGEEDPFHKGVRLMPT